MTYATTRHDQYRADVQSANDHYRSTGDLAGFQALNREARDTWHADIRAHYNDNALNAELQEALAQGGRVYATLNTGEIVRVHNIGNLYDVSDITGAPAEPLIARMVGSFDVKHTTVADLISRA
jgi:Fic family protein